MNEVFEHVRAPAEGREVPICAFVYDLEALRKHVRTVASLPSGCRLFYAIKANSERPVPETMAPFVDGFEVASLGEIRRVRGRAGGTDPRRRPRQDRRRTPGRRRAWGEPAPGRERARALEDRADRH